MYGVPIKFRGMRVSDCKLVFGSLVTDYETNTAFILTEDRLVEVILDSVNQLCGYDSDGFEVYEADDVIDKNGVEWSAVATTSLITGDDELRDAPFIKFEVDENQYRLTEESKKFRPPPDEKHQGLWT